MFPELHISISWEAFENTDVGLSLKDSGVIELGWVQAWQVLKHFQSNSNVQLGFRIHLHKSVHPVLSSGSQAQLCH